MQGEYDILAMREKSVGKLTLKQKTDHDNLQKNSAL